VLALPGPAAPGCRSMLYVCGLCNASIPSAAWGAPHRQAAGRQAAVVVVRGGMLACPFSNSLAVNAPWQGIFSGCAGSNACNATVAHLWAGEAASIPLLSIGVAWGMAALSALPLCCCLLAPTALRLDQLPTCWGLGPSPMDGSKLEEVQEGMHTCIVAIGPLQWLHLTA